MEILLRERRRVGAAVEYHDREVSARAVTIGSAPDQTIQLLGDVGPQHASIGGKAGALRIDCVGGHRVKIDGKLVRSSRLVQGARIGLAGHELEIIEPPTGFDVGIQVSVDTSVRPSEFESAFRTRLAETALGNRKVSWAMLVAVVLGGLIVPLHLSRAPDPPDPSAWRLDDRIWSTGRLLPAHELNVGNQCSACHVELFQRVQDEQCTVCHVDVLDHVEAGVEAVVGSNRCATCHKEHNDPQYFVVRRDALCTSCHSRPEDFPQPAGVSAVSGFAPAAHPPFDVHVLAYRDGVSAGGLSLAWEDRIDLPENAKEQSNLKFPHDVHLDPQKVLRPRDSSALACGDCHVLSSDGEHFAPAEMERHCRDCHDLKFDSANPERELPHGMPTEVVYTLKGYFYNKFNDPAALPTTQPRRTPWSSDDDSCVLAPNACAASAITEAIVSQFSTRGCIVCHVVDDSEDSNVEQRFDVRPVRLQTDYFPASGFPHDKHLTQGDAAGDAACATCHAANESAESSEVLIPRVDTCLECHADRTVPQKVPVDCVSCHSYHPHAPSSASLRVAE